MLIIFKGYYHCYDDIYESIFKSAHTKSQIQWLTQQFSPLSASDYHQQVLFLLFFWLLLQHISSLSNSGSGTPLPWQWNTLLHILLLKRLLWSIQTMNTIKVVLPKCSVLPRFLQAALWIIFTCICLWWADLQWPKMTHWRWSDPWRWDMVRGYLWANAQLFAFFHMVSI